MPSLRLNRWIFLAGMTAVLFAADVLSKKYVVANLSPASALPLAGTWLQLFLVYNKGALFGLNPAALVPGFPINIFFYVFSSIAIIVLLVFYTNLPSRSVSTRWGIALILPGALGNLFDRIIHPAKGVVDFIMVDLNVWPLNPWPIFNFADIYVSVGVALILFTVITDDIAAHVKKRGA